MSKTDLKKERENLNPFLTDKAKELWEKLDKSGSPVSKEELINRAKDLKKKKQ